MPENQRLSQEYDVLSKMGYLKKDIPKYIEDNLNPRFKLRPYQIEAIARFIHYLEENPNRKNQPSYCLTWQLVQVKPF